MTSYLKIEFFAFLVILHKKYIIGVTSIPPYSAQDRGEWDKLTGGSGRPNLCGRYLTKVNEITQYQC